VAVAPRTRAVVLGLAQQRWVSRFIPRHGLLLGARRFVAGERLEDGLAVVARLNREGIEATLDYLGESVQEEAQARAAAQVYLQVVEAIAERNLRSHISLKPSQLGLDLDRELALELVGAIVARAEARGTFVRLDMEDSSRTQRTLDLFAALRQRWENVGIVIQAALRRSEADLEALARMGANVRLCKGAYLEPPEVAFPRKEDVDANYTKLLRGYLASGNYLAVATHDDRMIEAAKRAAAELGIGRDRFEFQMLYGIRPQAQRRLVAEGYRVRVYVPFGTEWYPYFTRRLAERPANLLFLLANLVRR